MQGSQENATLSSMYDSYSQSQNPILLQGASSLNMNGNQSAFFINH